MAKKDMKLKSMVKRRNTGIEVVLFFEFNHRRQWNPFRSKLGAAILGGVKSIYMKPGSKVLYLGAASGSTVSHVADLVGPVCTISLRTLNFRSDRCCVCCRILPSCWKRTVRSCQKENQRCPNH